MKAVATGLGNDKSETRTVAVKMVLSQTSSMVPLEALVNELKVLLYLGSHLNIVNLLGACTKNIFKGDLLVMVEYCRHGNLRNYLISQRKNFVNQLDPQKILTVISTRDLLCWSFQIARAMDFLSNKKVNLIRNW